MWLLMTITTTSTFMVGGSFSFCPSVSEVFRCSRVSPPVSSTRITTRASRPSETTTELPLAFFLPDEDRQTRQEDEGPKQENGDENTPAAFAPQKKDNKSMEFLKRMGRVGGAANKNFVNAVGSDEGSTGRQPPAPVAWAASPGKSRSFRECTVSGVVDDLSEPFPYTTSGSSWRGVTDRVAVPGGMSNGSLRRERDLNGRAANVLAGRVLAPRTPHAGSADRSNNGTTEGFLQMVTDLPLDPSRDAVDASDYDGIELDVMFRGRSDDSGSGSVNDSETTALPETGDDRMENVFHLHVRAPGTLRQASYRHTFALERADAWETVRVPFSGFRQRAAAASDDEDAMSDDVDDTRTLDPTAIKRIGVVAMGREKDIFLAIGGLRFYSVV